MSTDSVSLNVKDIDNKGHGGRFFRTNFQGNNYANGYGNHGDANNSSGGNYYPSNNNNRSSMVCDYCKRTGHIKDKCYKLHGYTQSSNNQNNRPGNYNGGQSFRQQSSNYKGKRVVANVHGTVGDMVSANGEEQSKSQGDNLKNVNFKKEQYGQIMSLLHHFQNENMGEDAGANNASGMTTGSMNFAGTLAPLVKRPQVLGNCRDGLYFLCTKCLKTSDRVNTYQYKVFVSDSVPLKCKSSSSNKNFLDDHNSCSTTGDNSFSSPDYTDLDSRKNYVIDFDNVTDTTSSHPPNHITQNPNTPSTSNTSSTSSQHDTSTVVQIRSHRENKIPSHLKDYIVNIPNLKSANINTQNTQLNNNLSLTTLFTKHHHIYPEVIASNSQSLVENICHDSEPSSYEEASLNPACKRL
ncbi:uncharacterized protein [Solanum lycopersicum]|uniref:uncharacterized protein n=1 Tax=Solanum lycopersicum TaxID=4081 RepID=UPI0008FEBFD2|nr:probable serine/threonine-protein kinase clkA [Solanum lycopersicum]